MRVHILASNSEVQVQPLPERLVAALSDRYRIERELGQGGMATVYLAEDIKHKRRVAVKVLKPELAAVLGAERFVQEITTTAALQHPHILPLFDSGTADGFLYYVMPFVDGETLRGKLDRETQLGVDEAVKITVEVAEALHYAHSQGVIHRDIKPENILMANGRPTVADFGIALAVSAAAGGRMTETGLSLGTPHYMSPEQATAEKEISARSDVYSLASVLYEMLAGNPPHTGSSAQQIIMKIITEQPQSVTALRKSVPMHVAAALAKALEKLPADRFESAKAFADALRNAEFTFVGGASGGHSVRRGRDSVSARSFVAVALVAVLATAVAVSGLFRAGPVAEGATRYEVTLSSEADVASWRNLDVSPDGRSIVYTAGTARERGIWIKAPGSVSAVLLPGTEGAIVPRFSPNGEWIAFASGKDVRKVAIQGGEVITIAAGENSDDLVVALAWMDDGTVLFSGARVGIRAVDESGGPVRMLVPRDSLPQNLHFISPVRGTRAALFVICASNCAGAQLWALDVGTGKWKSTGESAVRAWSVTDGPVFFARSQSRNLFAAPFDAKQLAFSAPPTLVLEGVRFAGGEEFSFALAANGTMLYRPAPPPELAQAAWISRSGLVTPLDSSWTFTSGPGFSLSPDGARLAVTRCRADEDDCDIWLRDLGPDGVLTRLTFDENASEPEWSADGRSVLYLSGFPPESTLIKRRLVDGTGVATTLVSLERDLVSFIPLRDGSRLIARTGPRPTRDINIVTLLAGQVMDSLTPLIADDQFEEIAPQLSPDERWLAFASNASGRQEVYIVPFPDVQAGRWQASLNGGNRPQWARSGKELFFTSGQDLNAVTITTTNGVTFGARRRLFSMAGMRINGENLSPTTTGYETSLDDSRFLVLRDPRTALPESPRVILVQNWLSEVSARLRTPK